MYGSSPRRLISSRNTINEVRIRAHLCPFLLRGVISCFVIRLIIHSCRAESRSGIHRLLVDGSRRAGNVIETRIRGIPSSDGLENWSKKLKFMVKVRGWCLGLLGPYLMGGL